jgi:hypothetical protein
MKSGNEKPAFRAEMPSDKIEKLAFRVEMPADRD